MAVLTPPIWDSAQVIQIELPMVEPLSTAHGTTDDRPLVLVHLERDGAEGWGECVALPDAAYDGESSNEGFNQLSAFFAGDIKAEKMNRSAAYALDMATTDLKLREAGRLLADSVAWAQEVIPLAVVGLGSFDATVNRIERQKAAGYRHFKLKVTPSSVGQLEAVRRLVGDCSIRLDANGSFDWNNADHRGALERLGQMFSEIEQPFAVGSEQHCFHLGALGLQYSLDESVSDRASAQRLIESGFNSMVIKPYRFKSIDEVVLFTRANKDVRFSLGGMIDGPLSRAVNIAIAATDPFADQPAEIAVDGRWFSRSYSSTTVTIENNTVAVPQITGIGAVVDRDAVDDMTVRSNSY